MAREQALREDTTNGEKHELQPELISIMKEEVGKAKESRIPIIRAFEEIARRSGLKSNTIRNYYYRYIHANEETMRVNTEGSGEGISREDAIGTPFTDEETKELMREMLTAQARGESVRGCANRLGNGDKRMLIRFQNKYRSIIAREPEYVENLIRQMKEEGIPAFNPYIRMRSSRKGRPAVTTGIESSGGPLLNGISQFAANMQNVEVASLWGLVKGLCDLSALAAGNQGLARRMENTNRESEEQQNRIRILERSLTELRNHNREIEHKLNQLIEVNRSYMDLSDEDKLSDLTGYLSRVRRCIQG